MENILLQLEHGITSFSNFIWPIFLPFMFVMGLYMVLRTIPIIKHMTQPSKLQFKNLIGPASISLGAMIGTGAIIGVLGAISKLYEAGQHHIEAIAIWALIGAVVMVPVSYAETLNSKVMGKAPKQYIAEFLNSKLAVFYAVCLVALTVFGFGGFQFSGIDAVSTIIASKFMGIELSLFQRYVFIVIPVIALVALIVLSKKDDVFMNAMTYMIGSAVAGYFVFFILFVFKTSAHIPTYVQGMISGIMNPVNVGIGLPLGLMLGMQKVLQTAETGLGCLAMSAQQSDSAPREAGLISVIPTALTIFVSIVVTSYIASYGLQSGTITYPQDAVGRLLGFFETAQSVTGVFGLVILSLFTVLSAMTTILGSYYYLRKLFGENAINKNISIYLTLVVVAGTLAVFGANVVFEAVDLLLFVLCGINLTALTVFAHKKSKQLKAKNDKK